MLIPFGHEPTAEERYKKSYLSRLRKAEHLSSRLKQFIDDVNDSKLKEKDKIAVKEAALNFLKISSNVPVSRSFHGRDEEDSAVIEEAKRIWQDGGKRKIDAVKYMMANGWGLRVAHDYCRENFG